ncbi:MAG: biotin--[acetyl-CoA-carboxylase] ligase, partial [Bradyrhizobium sp.]|uniref:biotin--[acetyl-CoA-carboxylase] ligase n=1 Tax=Bradyrhizobium sp. TaxID=376 RepID=UPI003C7DDE76
MAFTLGPRATKAGYGLIAFDQAGSTNAEALARARGGERGPCWYVTTEQTAGRGRRQRAWIAPRGNLAASVLEVLDVTPAIAATLGFAVGVAMASALRQVSLEAVMRTGGGQLDFALKWP